MLRYSSTFKEPLCHLVILILIALPGFSQAQTSLDSMMYLPEVKVLGHHADRLFRDVPGAVTVIGARELKSIAPLNTSDVLRKSPGIHVIDEDGAGLRTNIGVRGLNPIRSNKVLVLEDGIPITLNPYGEPSLYFSPVVDKMEGIEVLKGSGQLEFGPQTIGGVVNFITARPPQQRESRLKINAGGGGYISGYGSHGNTVGNVGYQLNVTHKRADQLGALRFNVTDISGKLHMRLGEKSSVGVKLGYHNENSNSTYLGITQDMYDRNDNLRTTLTPDDLMLVRKLSASIVHNYRFNDRVDLQTTAYGYTIRRDWRRQQFSRNGLNENSSGVVWGNPSLTNGGAIFMSNRTDWRNRQYEVGGVEVKLNIKHSLFSAENNLKTGARFTKEAAYEQFVQGKKPDSWGGTMRDNEVRLGTAFSGFVINNTKIGDNFSIEYGLRLENYDYERRIHSGRFSIGGSTVVRDTLVAFTRSTFAFLPGVGINYSAGENVSFFAGVHRGFAPPVVKSAINESGAVSAVDKEVSTNYELGARWVVGNYLTFSPTLFYTDFENQVIPVTLATNATGIANGGRTLHKGIEADLEIDVAKALGSKHSATLGGNVTYTDARFNGDDAIDNVLPYAPRLVYNHRASLSLSNGFGVTIYGNYVGKQFSDNKSTAPASRDGMIGKIDGRYLLDATVLYKFRKRNVTLNVSGKNLLNKKYIASRNPEGIRVGLDRFITAGVDIHF
jgi:Fe(3+) dicitrate transport protein